MTDHISTPKQQVQIVRASDTYLVDVVFDDNASSTRYTYKATYSQAIGVGDSVLVEVRGKLKVVQVVNVIRDPGQVLDILSKGKKSEGRTIPYLKWIVSTIDRTGYDEIVKQDELILELLLEHERKKALEQIPKSLRKAIEKSLAGKVGEA